MECSGRGLGGAFGVVLLLYSTCLIVPVGGDPRRDVFCAQVGQTHKDGPFTIGGKLSQPTDRDRLREVAYRKDDLTEKEESAWIRGTIESYSLKACKEGGYDFNFNHVIAAYLDFCPKDVEIRAYLVKQHDRVLKGWLHFEVEITGDKMVYVLIQIRDEAHNFVGEFVTDEDEQCSEPNNPELVHPTKYQVLPCSAVGLKDARVVNSIFMSNADGYDNIKEQPEGFLPKRNIGRGVHFNWRLNEYWCNRHQRFRVEANVWSENSRKTFIQQGRPKDCRNHNEGCRIKRKTTAYWIYPNWIGASEIKLPGKLDCSTPAINYTNGTVHTEASWINRSSRLVFGDDFLGHGNVYDAGNPRGNSKTKGCQVDPIPNSAKGQFWKNDFKIIRTFGGRCTDFSTKKPTFNTHHGCPEFKIVGGKPSKEYEHVDMNNIKFTPYSNYSQKLLNARLKQCEQTCVEPNITNPDDLKAIKSYPRGNKSEISKNMKPKIVLETLLTSRHEIRATTFWQTRKFHGSLCIFLTLFLIPISNFFIRYYKETFMHSRGLGCAPWFWFHLFVCFAVPTLLWCSYSAMTQNIHTFGRSTSGAAVFHRVLGRVFVTGFILMICLGGLRPVQTRLRLVCMALHSVVGFAIYIIGIILIVTSTYIPASPSLADCDKKDGLPIGFSFTAIMALAWLAIDTLFHVLMTILQFLVDRRYEIKRTGCGFPFVPMLPAISPHSRPDLVGSRLRKVVLLLYVFLAAIITYLTIAELFGKVLIKRCTLGELTCNLSEVSPNMASSPFGCSAFAIKYYASVYTKYDFKD